MPYFKQVTVKRMDEALWEELHIQAIRKGVTMSQLLIMLIKDYLERIPK